MKACIMCGGEGTRLRPLTFERPKPCIPIANKPSIVHLVTHLANLGFTDIVLTIGYMGDDIQKALGDGSLYGANITYVPEEIKLGTAGSVKNAQKYLEDAPFLVVGGDHMTDLNLLEFYRDHMNSPAITSIGLISIEDPREFGIAEIDASLRIRRFREKPAPGEIFSNLASTGIYVCDPEIFGFIPENTKFDFAKDLFPLLMEKGYQLNGWLARGNWTDVGNPAMLRAAEKWILQEKTVTSVSGTLNIKDAHITGPVTFGDGITLGAGSRIVGPVLVGNGVMIGDNVIVGPYTSIGDNCVIKTNAKIFSSSIYNGVVVGSGTTISGSIVDVGTNIGDECSVEHNTVIGARSILQNDVTIHSGTRLWPEVIVKEGSVVKIHLLNPKFDSRFEGS
ncbi:MULTISPECIES: nucleotidyltransferase family protein [Methanocorpusculum]|uniref:Bifunctional protein GlmU n=1 Tax=Methanocorpusculum parvum TaxID=2193 RepID=A0AAX0Q900_9EURY|nr:MULTISPECIES: NDP-sugar synthase [Methanocorpusculum]MDD2248978.1 NDP-sugar synthase [Methanocorpusculum sp.]MDD2803369.1 NDP-sugar synthase [Methanocorpusculum sp.]MDD3046779.1 NDP-sugar synthase [Methanocorpusculum sp.]MDD3912553.1 NDP-sugar synthase [Methanocorpusculum sp.]MDD4423718.1 NDP-sugar synthase [Methanocorpusculum parvum]